MNITVYYRNYQHENLERLNTGLLERNLIYRASELSRFGLSDPEDLRQAVQRAIHVCISAGIPVRQNFSPLYAADESGIFCDWKLSELGKRLVLLNANTSNQYVAHLQMKIINSL